MQVANPSIPAFSPPTQLVDNTGTNPPITTINTTFSLSTGMLSLASYSTAQAVGTYTVPTGFPNNSAINNMTGTLSCSNTFYPITAANSAIPATAPTLTTVNTAMPAGTSGTPSFYAPDNTILSPQNSNLWNYSATGGLISTIVTNTNGSVSAPTIAAATSNVTAVTSSSSTTNVSPPRPRPFRRGI